MLSPKLQFDLWLVMLRGNADMCVWCHRFTCCFGFPLQFTFVHVRGTISCVAIASIMNPTIAAIILTAATCRVSIY